MDEIQYLTQIVSEKLKQGIPLVLVSLISQQGSTPRHGSTKMAISADGQYGTIGGSLLEATAIRESQDVLSTAQSKIFSFELTGKDAAAAGMICGGRSEVLLDYLPATKENLEFFRYWEQAVNRGDEFYVLTYLKDVDKTVEVIGHSILYSDGRVIGNDLLNSADIEALQAELHNTYTTSIVSLRDTRVAIDPIRKLKTLYCFGAGHVAVPTVHLAALVGFRVVVVEDRPEFANRDRFPDARQIQIIKDFNQALEGLKIDSDSFIVILTRSHQYDRAVLEQALKNDAVYIGMIGSHRKRDAIYEALMQKGFSKEILAQVHCPIGVEIDAETPAEIAVSIVAELIHERNKQQI